jgi:hypothetical protein
MAFGWLKKLPGIIVKGAEKVLVIKKAWELVFPPKPKPAPKPTPDVPPPSDPAKPPSG